MSSGSRSKNRNRSRSPLNKDSDRTEAPKSADYLSVEDLKKLVSDSITSQLPTIIVEASKVARAGLSVDREDSAKQMAKEMKQLKQSHEDLATVSKAAALKSEGKWAFSLVRINLVLFSLCVFASTINFFFRYRLWLLLEAFVSSFLTVFHLFSSLR